VGHDFGRIPLWPIERKSIVDSPADSREREADRVADNVLAGRRSAIEATPPAAPDWPVAPDRAGYVEAALAGGEPLRGDVRARVEPGLGMDLSAVRVHHGPQAARAAEALRARAFASGPHVVFGAGQYAPGTQDGLRLLAHELAHVVQQGAAGAPRIDRANAADARLPANQPEAIAHAVGAAAAITAALTSLGGSAVPRSRNVPALVAQQGLTVRPLTPRHDSTVATAAAPNPPINFFTGSANYADSAVLSAETTRSIDAARTHISIRARAHASVDNLLPAADIESRVVQAVSEVAHTLAAQPNVAALSAFDLYRARFNALYQPAPSIAFEGYDATLSSRGPKTLRSRSVFNTIYAQDSAFAAAYDANVGGLKEQVDRYQGPEGLNLIDSPGLQRLRTATFAFATPLPAADYVAFKAAITAVAQTLAAEDRAEVDRSNDWQLLIDSFVAAAAQRDEIKNIIRTATPPAPAPPPPPGGPAPPPAGGGAVTPQMFVNAVRLHGPAAAVPAIDRTVPVALTPSSGALNNPGVAISTRITVTPAASVAGPNVSPVTVWTAGTNAGAVFTPTIAVTGPIALDAQLALMNGPAGLAPAAAIPPLRFNIDDRRQANMGANWRPGIQFNDGSRQVDFIAGSAPRYVGGGQTIDVHGEMPLPPNLNPGLTLSVQSRIERGGVVIGAPDTKPYPPGAAASNVSAFAIAAPAVVPAAGDNINVITQLRDSAGAAVGAPRPVAMNIGPEANYTQLQAETRWTQDEAHLHSAAGFIASLIAAGGAAAGLAGNIRTAANPAGQVIIHPMIQRHDSAAYVAAQNAGVPNPRQAAYLITTPPYSPHPDPNHTIVLGTGAGGWRIQGGHPAYAGTFILLSRTPDVTLAVPRRPDAELQTYAVHESTHFMDRGHGPGPIEQYKTEFRAYWMDGRFGPPDQAAGGPGGFDAVFDATIRPPGPKSPRANRIFHETYDAPRLYPYCQPNYDANTNHFREEVDSYLVPDGINLILGARLESLRIQFLAGIAGNFAVFRTQVQGFFGVGAAPAAGVLSAAEKTFITQSRAWRDQVDNLVGATPAQKAQLKTDMGIP
jgi:hypothetical protein